MATLLLVLLTAGCGLPTVDDPGEAVGGSPRDAAGMVELWLAKARTKADDRGWSLLYPDVRDQLIGSIDVYRSAVDAADWTAFHPQLGEVTTRDGEYRVAVRVTGGERAVPGFMLQWGLIQFPRLDGQPTEDGFIVVRIPPTGSERGIQATG